MENLRLVPEIGERDIRVGFEVGGRTVSTHTEWRRARPVLISLRSLIASLHGESGPPLFACRCERAGCEDAPAVRTEIAGDELIWRVALPQGELVYELNRSQVVTEADRAMRLVGSKTERAHPARYRFHPPVDSELFVFQSVRAARLRTSLASVAYFSAVAVGVALTVGILRAV